MTIILEAIAIVLACITLSACREGPVEPVHARLISAGDYGSRWPFTTDQGVLSCEIGNHVILIADGRRYAINGSAKGAAPKAGYVDSTPIVKLQPITAKVWVQRLSEEKRREIFAALVKCDDDHMNSEAKADGCKAAVAKRHELDAKEAAGISEEGGDSFWPPLEPLKMSTGQIIQDGLKLCAQR